MCQGVALAGSEVPTEWEEDRTLKRRAYRREGKPEYRFLDWDREPRLPILWDGRLSLVRWGNTRRESRFLPRSNWTWWRSIERGEWRWARPELVTIAATFAVDRGRWMRVVRGIEGLLVIDEWKEAAVYMICEPSSHTYKVMTRSGRMPRFIDQCF